MKLLIDTGANKNLIKPGILQKSKQIKGIAISNLMGSKPMHGKGIENFLGKNVPVQKYYEIHFHKFFDGLIGSEFLAENNSIINYKKGTIEISGVNFYFEKYYPSQKTYHHFVTLPTNEEGHWIVYEPTQIYNGVTVQPGLYSAIDKKTTFMIESNKPIPPKMLNKQINLKVNNFETITPIPIDKGQTLTEQDIRKLIRLDHLSEYEKTQITGLILKNQKVLLKTNEKLTATNIIKHRVITTDEKPTFTKCYRYPHHLKHDVEEQIKELFDNGIITHSTSPYSSPVWVVPKKQDASGKRKIRVVIDYRKLNEKTVEDKYPIPQIEEILDNLGKSVYFTTLDLKSGFHQIEMDPKDRAKTAFSTTKGHFEFARMPFGLKNAPAAFQRAMNSVLTGLIGNICFVYLDDIIVIGESLNIHLKNLNTVLERLANFNLKIQLDKCEFLKRETEFLGHTITPEGIKPNPDKISKILDWKLPTTQKEIKQFLGLTGYYRRFIKDYSKLTKPLSKCLKKDSIVDFKHEEYKKSFNELKKLISSDQILAYPDFELPFILTTDASNYALGAVLSQIQDGIEKPIAFGSRTLNKTEVNYSTTEKEALAIIWAVEKYKPYLYGRKFKLITDHKPLTFIKTSTKNSKILRWRLELENFDYDIQYKEGKANVVADALSRKTCNCSNENINENSIVPGTTISRDVIPSETTEISINLTESSPITEYPIEENEVRMEEDIDSQTAHSADTSDDFFIHFTERPINYYRNQIIFKISRITTNITENPFPNFKRVTICKPLFDESNIKDALEAFHNNKQTAIMAPEELLGLIQSVYRQNFNQNGHFILTQFQVEDVTNTDRQDAIIAKEHERAHRGISEVENQIRRSYFFPCMASKIRIMTNLCKVCNTHKYERKPYNIKLSPRPSTNKPLERVHMDIFQIDRCNFLSLVDSFSKHLQLIPIATKNITDVQSALTQYFTSLDIPAQIITDHETTFRSLQLKNYLNNLNVELLYVSCSESNGQVEKTHSTILEILNTNKDKFRDLDTSGKILMSVSLYNNSVHSSTKYTPNEIIFNRRNEYRPDTEELFAKVKTNLEKARQTQLKRNENKEDPPTLNENDEVFVIPNIRKKLDPRAKPVNIHDVKNHTFKNSRNVKRHKNKTKRRKRNL